MTLSSCRSDPRFTLANGSVLSATCTVYDDPSHIQNAAFTVSAPSGVVSAAFDNVFPETYTFGQILPTGDYSVSVDVHDSGNTVEVVLEVYLNGALIASATGTTNVSLTAQNYGAGGGHQ